MIHNYRVIQLCANLFNICLSVKFINNITLIDYSIINKFSSFEKYLILSYGEYIYIYTHYPCIRYR